MGYSWSTSITSGSKITASVVYELQTNTIDPERAARNLPGYAWSQVPTQFTDKILNNRMVEMRSALDQAHTENYCHTDIAACTTHYSSNNASVAGCASNYATDNAPYYANNYGTDGGCTSHNAADRQSVGI
jgi:hypothetical protein